MHRILAFAASNSQSSINRSLVTLAAGRFRQGFMSAVEIEYLDLNDFEMPIYSIDRETASGIPDQAELFYHKIGSSDGLFVSFAEHNGTVTAAWKNIFDWMSRIDSKVWQQKKLLLLAATPGKRAGAGVLEYVGRASFFGGEVVATLGIGHWAIAFDAATQSFTRQEDWDALDSALSEFSRALTRSART
ncbi:MAG: NAD(P)H-dependent oxidoreductase [Pseudomonadota bacterium]